MNSVFNVNNPTPSTMILCPHMVYILQTKSVLLFLLNTILTLFWLILQTGQLHSSFFLLNDLISNVFKFFPHGFVTLTILRAFELKKLAPLPRIVSSLTALTINSLKKC